MLVLGGDLVGKGIVPIIEREHGYAVSFQGQRETVDAASLESVQARIAFNGLYPYVCSPADVARLDDPAARMKMFGDLARAQIRRWDELAAARLDDGIRCIVTPGNDDPWLVDRELGAAQRIESPERRLIPVGPVQLASLASTNPTPWRTDREFSEAQLCEQIELLIAASAGRGRAFVFNFHCPPRDSGLDLAVELDHDLRPVVRRGEVAFAAVGSTAIRAAIEHYRPTIGLHGHIHDAQGVRRIGPTRCFNPGSDYASGVLKGVLIDLDARGECRSYLFTTG